MVDITVLLIIIFFILAGWLEGCWRNLLELLITVISLGLGWFYYQLRHEIFTSILVVAAIFFCLRFCKWCFLRVMQQRETLEPSFSFSNHFLGGVLGFIRGVFISGLLILTLDLFSPEIIFHYNIKEKIHNSLSRRMLQSLIPKEKVPIVENLSLMSKISRDKKAMERLITQPQFQELLQHESLKAITEDEELVKQLQNNDLPRLLANPKIRSLLNDAQFVEKLLKLDFKKALENR